MLSAALSAIENEESLEVRGEGRAGKLALSRAGTTGMGPNTQDTAPQ